VSDLASLPPGEALAPGHYGIEATGVSAKALDLALVSIVSGRNKAGLAAALEPGLGLALPDGPKLVEANGIAAIGTGPGRWLLATANLSGDALLIRMQALAGSFAAVCDQSDASVVYELSGPHVRDTLMKLVLIDIEAFAPGQAATTQAALIGVTLWRTNTAYRVLVARSYELAFLRALAVSAAEFGLAYA